MLRFTPEQNQLIVHNRVGFNNNQAQLQASFHNGAALLGNASPLPRDVWGQWDRDAVEIQREVLSVFNDLSATLSQSMDIGKIVSHFMTSSTSSEAHVSLDGRSKGLTDQPVMEYHGTPLPIVDVPYSYGWRQMAAAATEGYQLDSYGRDNANWVAAKKLESIALDGDAQIVVGGDPLYGLRTHPKRNTRSTGVTLNGATGPQWLAEINAITDALYGDNFYVEPTLYVNITDWKYARETDYSSAYPNKTIAQRVLESGITNVVPASDVAVDEIIAVVKNRRVLKVLNGMPMVTRAQFRANPEDDYNFVVMAAAALQIQYDAEDNCGIVHSS